MAKLLRSLEGRAPICPGYTTFRKRKSWRNPTEWLELVSSLQLACSPPSPPFGFFGFSILMTLGGSRFLVIRHLRSTFARPYREHSLFFLHDVCFCFCWFLLSLVFDVTFRVCSLESCTVGSFTFVEFY